TYVFDYDSSSPASNTFDYFFIAPPTSATSTLSLHDALPIYDALPPAPIIGRALPPRRPSSGPIDDPSAVHRWTRCGPAAGPPRGTIPVHERAQRLDQERPRVNCLAEQLTVYPAAGSPTG